MHFVRFFTYIASCLSVARATFSVTVGTPTQCDPLTISWTGGEAPFEILLTPAYAMYYNISVPSSAFSNGKGSYSPQLLLTAGTKFLFTMSDATGFGSGGTTNQLIVGPSVTNDNCNTINPSSVPPFTFDFSPSPPPLTQCSQLIISTYGTIYPPITIVQLIPGGQPVVNSVNSDTFKTVIDVDAGTTLQYFITDSEGRQGGVSNFEVVSGSDSSCLSANSPSSTAGMSATASPTSGSSSSSSSPSSSSSSSPSGGSSSSNVAIIGGAAGGGAAVLIALVILVMCLWRKRRTSRSPDIQSSKISRPHQLQRTDPKYEASSYSDVPPSSARNFAFGTPPSSFNQTQHSRQSSNTDFPGSVDGRSSTMSSAYSRMAALSQPISPNYPLQYPVSFPPPIRPGSQSPPLNTSAGNFPISDRSTLFSQTLHSRQSSNPDFAVYGDARSSAMSSADRRMTTVAETSLPLPWEMDPVSYLGPPIQFESQPSHINASAANLAARDLPVSFNQTQPSHKNSNTDFAVYGDTRMSDVTPVKHMAAGARPASPLLQKTDPVYLAPPAQPGSQSISTFTDNVAVGIPPTPFNQTQNSHQSPDTAVHGASGSQSVASASAQTAAMAAGQTVYQPPTRIVVHTDADDVMPDSNGLIELPPQYSEHRGVHAL